MSAWDNAGKLAAGQPENTWLYRHAVDVISTNLTNIICPQFIINGKISYFDYSGYQYFVILASIVTMIRECFFSNFKNTLTSFYLF